MFKLFKFDANKKYYAFLKYKKFIIDSLLSCNLTYDEISFEKREFYIFEDKNDTIGFFALNIGNNYPALEYVYIKPHHRNLKHFKTMMKHCVKEAINRGYKSLIIDVKKGEKFKYLSNIVEKMINKNNYSADNESLYYVVFAHELKRLI
jgi:hypothetical protein